MVTKFAQYFLTRESRSLTTLAHRINHYVNHVHKILLSIINLICSKSCLIRYKNLVEFTRDQLSEKIIDCFYHLLIILND